VGAVNRSRAAEFTQGTPSAAEAIVRVLVAHGVTTVFGIPGLHTIDLYDALAGCREIRHVVTRHEQGAGFAADGYARVGDRPGVCIGTTGPGAFNALAALAEGWADSSPVLLLAGQIDADLIGHGRGVLHETGDQAAVFEQVTKFVARPRSPEALVAAVHEALAAMKSGRPRPAYVEMPTDLLGRRVAVAERPWLEAFPTTAPALPDPQAVERAARVLRAARRPLILAGGGVVRARATAELTRVAESLAAPVLVTVPGNGAVPADHPLFAGTIVPSQVAARRLLEEADAVLVAGSRLDAQSTGRWQIPLRSLVHLDIDAEVIGRSYPVAVALIGHARVGLAALADGLGTDQSAEPGRRGSGADWGAAAAGQARLALIASVPGDRVAMVGVMDELRAALPRETIITHDAATLNAWTAFFWPTYEPGAFLFPWGSATLGFALPAAIGAALAAPDRPVLATCGDGGFLFTATELATAATYGLDVTVLVHNNSGFESIANAQRARFGRSAATELRNPDLVAFARSFGVSAWRVDRIEALPAAVARAVASPGPAVVELNAPLRPPWD
jgi:acetolactate synthase-1/2/3 large subunit